MQRTLAAGPSASDVRSPIISSMQKTTPIRRYVLLRQAADGVPAGRWSMERIGGAQRSAAAAPAGSPSANTPGPRR